MLVLFAFFASRSELKLAPPILRSSGQMNYWCNIFIRLCLLASHNLLFFDRWWRYYCVCIIAGALGVVAGQALYCVRKPNAAKYQKMMQMLLFSCGLFFLFTPS